jgi:glycosyltransferase involved in cell wall biosynthesis
MNSELFVLQAGVVKGRGGITTAILHYARMLRDVGVDSIAAFRGPGKAVLSAEGVDILDAPPLLRLPLVGMPLLLREFKHQILTRAAGRRVVIVVHSDLLLQGLRRLFPDALIIAPCHSDKFRRKAGADLIVTLNAKQHELVRSGLTHARVALLGNPFVGEPVAREFPPGPPRINFVGRFVADKDPLCVVRAAELMKAHDVEFRFIGAGPMDEEVRAAAVASGARIVFAGWQAAPFQTMHDKDILVSASVWEGLPYLLQEALVHGVPIIASDIPGNSTALDGGRFGLLFETGDAHSLAGAITVALGDVERLRARARLGGSEVHARYGAQAFWAALTQALHEPLHREGGGRR